MKIFTLILLLTLKCFTSFAQTDHVVISEVFGAGGNTGATLKSHFIELYNPKATAVSLEG